MFAFEEKYPAIQDRGETLFEVIITPFDSFSWFLKVRGVLAIYRSTEML